MKKFGLFLVTFIFMIGFISCKGDNIDDHNEDDIEISDLDILNNVKTEILKLDISDVFKLNGNYTMNDNIINVYLKSTNTNIISDNGELLLDNDCNVQVDVTIKLNDERITFPMFYKHESIVSINRIIYRGYDALLTIDGYNNEDLIFTSLDENIALVFEDGYVCGENPGTCLINIKSNDKKIDINYKVIVKNQIPSIKLSKDKLVLDSKFSVICTNYKDSKITYEYDKEFLSFENNEFKVLKTGNTTIKVLSKDDPELFSIIEFETFKKEPIIFIETDEYIVGNTYRLECTNYSQDEYNIVFLEEGFMSANNNILTACSDGVCRVKVELKNDNAIFSVLQIDIKPIMPNIILSSEYITAGLKSYIFIDNIESLKYNDINDYEFTYIGTGIKLEDNIITGLNTGVATINCVCKKDSNIKSSLSINVIDSNKSLDIKKGLTKGPIILNLSNGNALIQSGEMIDLVIDGDTNFNNYQLLTSNSTILNVYDEGRVIAIKPGYVEVSIFNKNDKTIKGSLHLCVYGESNVDYVDRLIKVATKELGYREGPNNDTKYGAWYNLNNEAWCAMFVSWCCYQSGISNDIVPKYCGCKAGKDWFESRGEFGYKETYTPKAGDIIFFLSEGASHTGIVIACDGNTVYTIEGNTSNMVAKRSYSINYKTITGYGIPKYPNYNSSTSGDTSGSSSGEGETTL